MGSGFRLPEHFFPYTHSDSLLGEGCFQRTALCETPHPDFTARAFYASAISHVLANNCGPSQRPEMPAKRSLILDDQFEENSFSLSNPRRKKRLTAYSVTTGTCPMSPRTPPTTPKERERGDGPSNGKKKLDNLNFPTRKESTAKDNDKFMILLSKIERSSEKTMEIMKNLSSIQDLENNRQLGDLIGISSVPCFLKREVAKTRELITKVTKEKLFDKKSRVAPKEHHCNSFEFLKAILN